MKAAAQHLRGYVQWWATSVVAFPVWLGISSMLLTKFLKSPLKFCRKSSLPPMSCFRDDEHGFESRVFEVNGLLLHGVTSGSFRRDRQLVVLLHGFPETHHSWRYQLRALQGTFDVLALDMRGFGASDAPKKLKQYSMQNLCSDVVSVIESTGHQRCLLVAHDWGGTVAWTVAANYPEVIERLVVFCSPHPAAYKNPECFNAKQMQRSWYFLFFMCPWIPEIWLTCRNFEQIDNLMCNPPWGLRHNEFFHKEDLLRMKACLARSGAPTSAINYYRASLADQMIWNCAELNKAVKATIKLPTLLVYAENDAAFLPQMFSQTKDMVPNLQVIEIRNCSHWVQQDRPEVINQLLLQFLTEKATLDCQENREKREELCSKLLSSS